MASFTKFSKFVENLGRKVFNLNADTLKVALSNTAPTPSSNNQLSDITQISAGNGYATGGTAAGSNAYSQTGGTGKLTAADVVFTASGGTIGPFRYAVLYDGTATNGELIGYWDYGSSITLNDGETFTVDFDATAGILTVT
ncbi:MAG: hypothetical protein K2P78_04165 [Gemmataceae bacterium]|nr:hypothetical protein [Gemmataceae bacterium]